MIKGELERIKHLAKKNAEKAKKEIEEIEKKGLQNKNEKNKEKLRVNDSLDASEANRLFREMKQREF